MNYDDMHWKQLKKLVEERGGEYISKEDAVLFLNAEPVVAEVVVEAAAVAEVAVTAEPVEEMVFDKRQPYGEVSGRIEGYPGARFTQNGVFFNSQGKRIG